MKIMLKIEILVVNILKHAFKRDTGAPLSNSRMNTKRQYML